MTAASALLTPRCRRPMIAAWAAERRRLLAALILLAACVSGCLPRQRFNKRCEWTQDTPRPLHLTDARDRQHLAEDAQLAEELATRYADFKHKEVTGYEGHGGYLQQGQVTRGCMERMFAEIEREHGVTRQQISDARYSRDWRFDLAVLLSFVVIYVIGSTLVCRVLARTLGHHGARVWLIAVVFSSIAVALLGMALLGVWATTGEMLRVGNDHIGASRAAKSPWFDPWRHHFVALLVSGTLMFCVIAWLRRPRWEGKSPRQTGPQSLALH